MAAPYVKRYPGGFVDKPSLTTAVDSAFLNAVESALLQLLGEAPAADEVGVWVGGAGGAMVYQKITNAQIAAGAAIDKSKLGALNIVDADIAGAAAIAKSKLGPLNIADADIQAAAAIAYSKLNLAASIVNADVAAAADIAQSKIKIPSTRVTHSVLQAQAHNGGGTGGYLMLAFDTERWDTDTIHDTATNNSRLTCKTAGKYMVFGHFSWAGNAAGIRSGQIRFNGATPIAIDYADPSVGGQIDQNIMTVYDFAVNDYVELGVYQNSGGSVNIIKNNNTSPEFGMVRVA